MVRHPALLSGLIALALATPANAEVTRFKVLERTTSALQGQNVSRRQIRAHRSRSSIPRRMPMWRRSRLRRHGWWMSACCSPRMQQKRLPPRKRRHLPGLRRSQGAGNGGCRRASLSALRYCQCFVHIGDNAAVRYGISRERSDHEETRASAEDTTIFADRPAALARCAISTISSWCTAALRQQRPIVSTFLGNA